MKDAVIIFKNLKNYIADPLFYLCVFFAAASLFPELETGGSLGAFASFLFPFFIVYFGTKNARQGIEAAFCSFCADTVYFSLSGYHISLVFCVLLGAAALLLLKRLRGRYGFFFLLIPFVLISILAGLLFKSSGGVLKALCSAVKGKGFLFGAVNNFYDILFSGRFSDYFYHKDYGSAIISNGKIISGAVNIFKARPGSGAVSVYLTGKYFANIFLTAGIAAALFKRIDFELRPALCACAALSVIAGDSRLFSLFLLLCSPLIYFDYLLLISLSYFVSELLGLKIGFVGVGSIFELFKYLNSPVYFFITGFVLLLLSYFSEKLIISKYLKRERIYPVEIKILLKNLGGEKNITAVKDGNVEVKNPSLVDFLILECDVKGNRVFLNKKDYERLSGYF